MTQDEIIEMAQQCGLIGMRPHLDGIYSESLVAFANLVAAKEREACIVDIQMHIPRFGRSTSEYQMAIRMIERIRARRRTHDTRSIEAGA